MTTEEQAAQRWFASFRPTTDVKQSGRLTRTKPT